MLPNFIILGAQKAGTTSLHDWLSQHPEIFSVPELKDRDFFSHPERSLDPESHIQNYTSKYASEKILMHTHVNYLIYQQAIDNIKAHCVEDIKLLAILRSPSDRAVSAFNYFKKLRREKRSIEQALDYAPQEIDDFSFDNNDFTYLEHGFYSQQLERVKQKFDDSQLLVVDYLELKNDREGLMKKIFQFLDVDPNASIDFKAKNVTGEVRNDAVQEILSTGKGGSFLRTIMNKVTTPEMRLRIKEKLTEINTSKKSVKPILPSDDLVKGMHNLFQKDVEQLVKNHGLESAKNWPEYTGKRPS